MPLVIPDMNQEGTATGTTTGDKAEEWQNKLVGKTLHDEESNETVSPRHLRFPFPLSHILTRAWH